MKAIHDSHACTHIHTNNISTQMRAAFSKTLLVLYIMLQTIDPSSSVSGGSILGDKTRMVDLSREPGDGHGRDLLLYTRVFVVSEW